MTDKERESTWIDYKNNHSSELREKLIIEYAPLVKVVAGKMMMHLNGLVELDDLCSYGIFGLIDSIDKFELTKGVKFETYASLRIRGEILDNIRKMDWIPRTVRQKQKDIANTKEKLQSLYGREPSDDEIMEELGVDESTYVATLGQINATTLVYLDNDSDESSNEVRNVKQSSFILPESSVIKDELKNKIKESLEKLTEKEKQVILLYYYEELTLKEISVVLEVSESRISQLHTKALIKMRNTLGDYSDMLFNTI